MYNNLIILFTKLPNEILEDSLIRKGTTSKDISRL